MKETIELSNGYSARVETDQCAENPFTAFDCEPPIAVFSEWCIDNYGTEMDIPTLYWLLPHDFFRTPGGIANVMKALGITADDLPDDMREDLGPDPYAAGAALSLSPDDWHNALADMLPEKPDGWRSAGEYFDRMEDICDLAGIPCYNGQRSGYCQGDAALVFVAATPAWRELVGAPLGSCAKQCEAAADLWAAWAYGDVYGVAAIIRPDGTEIEEGSCWGFYGADHEKSGLIEHAEGYVQWDIDRLAKESAEARDMACRDIATVGSI